MGPSERKRYLDNRFYNGQRYVEWSNATLDDLRGSIEFSLSLRSMRHGTNAERRELIAVLRLAVLRRSPRLLGALDEWDDDLR
ncbi:hypothetical protein BH23ACT3_BH23ACT3_00370 [soil metagenome]